MKVNIRLRIITGLVLVVITHVVVQSVLFLAYEAYEMRTDPTLEREEEVAEVALLFGIDAITLPIMFGMVWVISRRILKPLQAIAHTAGRIGAGALEERVAVDNPEDELGQLAGSLNAAFDQYREAMDRIHRFSGDASHQLRTPLAVIRSMGEVALQRERSVFEYQATLEDILEEVQHLSRIVDQLLTLARMDPTELRRGFKPVDAGEAAESVVQRFALLAEDRKTGLAVKDGGGCAVLGDFSLLEQMLANLLDNALRYTPAQGRVEITTAVAGDRVLIVVDDSGPGIPAEYRKKVFDRFYRVPGSETPGSGLGLAIVTALVDLHHGTIAADESPLGGARFAVQLPLHKGPAA